MRGVGGSLPPLLILGKGVGEVLYPYLSSLAGHDLRACQSLPAVRHATKKKGGTGFGLAISRRIILNWTFCGVQRGAR